MLFVKAITILIGVFTVWVFWPTIKFEVLYHMAILRCKHHLRWVDKQLRRTDISPDIKAELKVVKYELMSILMEHKAGR